MNDRLVWIDCEMTGLDLTQRRAARDRGPGHRLRAQHPRRGRGHRGPRDRRAAGRDDRLRPGHARDVRADRCRTGSSTTTVAEAEAAGPRLHQEARPGAAQGSAVRQLDRHRPRVPRAADARRSTTGCTTAWSTSRASRSWPAGGTPGPTSPPRRRPAATAPSPTSARASRSCATTARPCSSPSPAPTPRPPPRWPPRSSPPVSRWHRLRRTTRFGLAWPLATLARRRTGVHMVGVAQLVEHRVVVPGVAGSSPVAHPM